MTIERMAEAILTLVEHIARMKSEYEDHPTLTIEVTKEQQKELTIEALRQQADSLQPMVDSVNAVVNAYMGGGVERHGRALIEAIAETNKAKRLCMNVLIGPGAGPWECIIRRDRTQQMPAIILPGSKEWN